MPHTTDNLVLSHFQTRSLLRACQQQHTSATTSADLGLSDTEVTLAETGVHFPGHGSVSWEVLVEINESKNKCFLIRDGVPFKIQRFSERTNRYYSLMPTDRAPTLLISGTLMHRVKGTDPWQDTKEKIGAVGAVTGDVLDTATGLGYTSILAARHAAHVTTIELDPAVLEIARLNPWSDPLFTSSRITSRIGDSGELIDEFADESFHVIIHDPPVISLAGHLYGQEFYAELYRTLRPGGRLFHYIGNPESTSGSTTTSGVIRRLQEAGFHQVRQAPAAFGVVASKGSAERQRNAERPFQKN